MRLVYTRKQSGHTACHFANPDPCLACVALRMCLFLSLTFLVCKMGTHLLGAVARPRSEGLSTVLGTWWRRSEHSWWASPYARTALS